MSLAKCKQAGVRSGVKSCDRSQESPLGHSPCCSRSLQAATFAGSWRYRHRGPCRHEPVSQSVGVLGLTESQSWRHGLGPRFLENGVTGHGECFARHVDLFDSARLPNGFRSQLWKRRIAGNVPLGLEDAVAIQISVLAAIKPNAADHGHLWCNPFRVTGICANVRICLERRARIKPTGNLDEFAAVLGNNEANALDCNLILASRGGALVSRWPSRPAICHAVEVMDELVALSLIPQNLFLASRLLNCSCPCLCLFLIDRGVNQL